MSFMLAPEWHLRRREHGALACRVWPGPDRFYIRQGHRVRLDRDRAGVDLVDEWGQLGDLGRGRDGALAVALEAEVR
jgi:hypothetical protein